MDVGFHRCGIDPDSKRAAAIVADVASLPGLRFLGLLSHAGHGYNASSEADVERIAIDEARVLRELAAASHVRCSEISVGATPTARFITLQHGATEMRPGNYVFYDRTQAGLGATATAGCAMSVVATVVSRPVASRVIFDAGNKTLTSDAAHGFGSVTGYGLVYPDLETATPQASIVIERLSEEHAVARVLSDCMLKPGDRVRILPNHACTVTNLASELLLVDGLTVVDRIQVAARGKNY